MAIKIFAGASGYSFKEWKGTFYPEKIKAEEMLAYYSERLPTVEINNTFYRMPKTTVLESWAKTVPASFRFSIKASRRITHISRHQGGVLDGAAGLPLQEPRGAGPEARGGALPAAAEHEEGSRAARRIPCTPARKDIAPRSSFVTRRGFPTTCTPR